MSDAASEAASEAESDSESGTDRGPAGGADAGGGTPGLILEFALDAPVDRVWRAIETPHLREAWLPGRPLRDPEHRVSEAGRELRFRMRDDGPPFAETAVTFGVRPGEEGGSVLRIVHEAPALAHRAAHRPATAANDGGPPLMRAA